MERVGEKGGVEYGERGERSTTPRNRQLAGSRQTAGVPRRIFLGRTNPLPSLLATWRLSFQKTLQHPAREKRIRELKVPQDWKGSTRTAYWFPFFLRRGEEVGEVGGGRGYGIKPPTLRPPTLMLAMTMTTTTYS